MAIDSQTKRRAVSGYTGVTIPPVPDGSIDQQDKPQIAGLFWFVAGVPIPVVPIAGYPAWQSAVTIAVGF